MKIKHNQNADRGSFSIEEGTREIALLTYRSKDNVMTINHTEVDEDRREQGLGGKLVKAAVDYAVTSGKKIKPVCPFAKAEFENNPSYSEVLN